MSRLTDGAMVLAGALTEKLRLLAVCHWDWQAFTRRVHHFGRTQQPSAPSALPGRTNTTLERGTHGQPRQVHWCCLPIVSTRAAVPHWGRGGQLAWVTIMAQDGGISARIRRSRGACFVPLFPACPCSANAARLADHNSPWFGSMLDEG